MSCFVKIKQLFANLNICLMIASLSVLFACASLIANQFIYEEKIKTEATDIVDLVGEMQICQEFDVIGTIKAADISVNSFANQESPSLSVVFKNDEMSISNRIYLHNDVPYPNVVKVNFPRNMRGKVKLYIENGSILEEHRISLGISDKTIWGGIEVDGVRRNTDLALSLYIDSIPKDSYIRLIFLAIMFLAILWLGRVIFTSEKKSDYLYWIAWIIILCNFCIRYPRHTFFVEPYFETGTNFFNQTYLRGWSSLILDDTGYLPLLPRAIACLFILVFNQTKYVFHLFAAICVFSVTFLLVEFIKPAYEKYMSVEERFLFVILMGATCYFTYSPLLCLHNLGYYGLLFVILMLLKDVNTMQMKQFWVVCVITLLFTLSKVYYVILLCIIPVVLVFKKEQIKKKIKIYCVVCCIGPLLQCIYIFGLKLAEQPWTQMGSGISVGMQETIYTFIQYFVYFFYNFDKSAKPVGLWLNILLAMSICFLVMYFVKNHKRNRSILCIALFVWALGVTLANSLSGRMQQEWTFSNILKATSYNNGRPEFLAFLAIFFVGMLVVSDNYIFKNNLRKKRIVVCLVLTLLSVKFTMSLNNARTITNLTNWLSFAKGIEMDNYAIPINDDVFFSKNAQVLFYGNREVSDGWVGQKTQIDMKNKLENGPVCKLFMDDVYQSEVIAVYTKKYFVAQPTSVMISFIDDKGNQLETIDMIAESDRSVLGVQVPEGITNVHEIRFFNKCTGMPYYVKPEIYVVVKQ